MTLLKNNAKRIFVLLFALILSFTLISCKEEKVDADVQKMEEALATIAVGNLNNLNTSFELNPNTNKHELPITWEVVCTDGTASLDTTGSKPKVVVTPTEYSEDTSGAQNNAWGTATLKATVTVNGKSLSREWEMHIQPGVKSTILTIAAAKDVADNTIVEIQGTVSFVLGSTFYVHDSTGGIYIYKKPTPEVKPGAVVKIQGTKKLAFSTTPEIYSDAVITLITAAPETGYDFSSVSTGEIKDIVDKEKTVTTNFGKIVEITGKVIKDFKNSEGTIVSKYAIQDVLNNVALAIYDEGNTDLIATLESKSGSYISLVVGVYDYHSSYKVWRAVPVANTIEDAQAPQLSEDEIVSRGVTEITNLYNNKEYVANIELLTATTFGATVTWTSDKQDVIANDGTLNTPLVDTVVTFTAVVTYGSETENVTITVTAKALQQQTIKQVIDAIDADSDKLISYVKIEGVIVGIDADGYYYLADETAVIFVRQKAADNQLKIGDKVQVIASAKIFTGSNNVQYTRQIIDNYTVTKLDQEIHESPLAAVDVNISDFDNTIAVTNVSQEELYGKLVRFDAYVTVDGDVFLTDSLETLTPKIRMNYKSIGLDSLKSITGFKVQIIGVVHDFHSTNGWRISLLGRQGDIVLTTEQQKIDVAKAEIDAIAKEGDIVLADLNFITETTKSMLIPGAKYVWTTNDLTTIAADGNYTIPDAEKTVIITVKLYLDGNTEGTVSATWDINVTAKIPAPRVPDLFFSEYGEGSSNNKWIEIYNPTNSAIDLSGYKIQQYNGGSPTATATLVLSGSLAAGETYVIYNASAVTEIKSLGDLQDPGSITWFNGDDALALCKGDVVIDVIGVIGEDPGTNWTVGTGATSEYTLVRNANIGSPNATFTVSEWTVFPQNTFSNIGLHTYNPVA